MRLTPKQIERFTNMVRQYPDFVAYVQEEYNKHVDTLVNTDDSKVALLQGKARAFAELLKQLNSLAQ